MTESFRRAGIEFDLAFDFDADACDSHEQNVGTRPIQMDVRDLLRMAKCGIDFGSVDLVVADPPCKPWSRAGKRRGTDDPRDMITTTVDFIIHTRPDAYLVGNVPGLDDSTNWPTLQALLAPLQTAGYCIADHTALNAANYGVPQMRIRPFWFGHLSGPCIRWPAPTHADPKKLATAVQPRNPVAHKSEWRCHHHSPMRSQTASANKSQRPTKEKNTMTKAIAKTESRQLTPVRELQQYLSGKIAQLTQWCKQDVDPASLVRFALADFKKSEKLRKCTMESIYLALVACAQVGLEPGGVMQHCFIIPYGGEAAFQLGYRGAIELANRSPRIARVGANLYYENDDFTIDIGSNARVQHSPELGPRGEIVGAYAFAKFANGEIDVEWTGMDDLTKIRDAGANGPAWKTWEDQMFRKAPIKRLAKRLPLTSECARAFVLDSQAEGGDRQAYRETLVESGVVLEDDDRNAPATGNDKLKAAISGS